MGDSGISFTGDGMKDISSKVDGTTPGNMGAAGGSTIEFAGDGAMEAPHNNDIPTFKGNPPTNAGVPNGGGISFAGDGAKDV